VSSSLSNPDESPCLYLYILTDMQIYTSCRLSGFRRNHVRGKKQTILESPKKKKKLIKTYKLFKNRLTHSLYTFLSIKFFWCVSLYGLIFVSCADGEQNIYIYIYIYIYMSWRKHRNSTKDIFKIIIIKIASHVIIININILYMQPCLFSFLHIIPLYIMIL
jgi:hypothetical protein